MSEKNRDYIVFLEDIMGAINKIENYTEGLSFEDFGENDMILDAVIRNFEVIGEAATHIPNEVKERYPDVEWKEAIGFRNVMIHEYFVIDVEAVWDTIRKNIPTFKKHVLTVLAAEQPSSQEQNN